MTALPKITVVTPSLNQGDFLEQAIRSVLDQGYPALEYLVVDGGSTDRSLDIIQRYQDRLHWWISEPDRGQAHALNKGFARATGEIFAYLNADDLYRPGALLAAARAYLCGHAWIAGLVDYLDTQGRSWPVPQGDAAGVIDWLLTIPVSQPGCFWSAALHRRAGPFDETLQVCCDYAHWLKLRFDLGVRPHRLREPLAFYRLQPEAKTARTLHRFAEEGTPLRARYREHLYPWQRARLQLARRRRRARVLGGQALDALADGDPGVALRRLGHALLSSPAVLADPVALGALIGRLTGLAPSRPPRQVFPPWDEW